MSNGGEAVIRLKSARQALHLSWQSARLLWNDRAQRDFERRHLNPLMDQAVITEREMDRLLQVIGQARQRVH